jgi:peptide-methionine (S)-S-oxide reductase
LRSRSLIGLVLWAGAAVLAPAAASPTRARAIFAGGCFWSEEKAFDSLPGVVSATSGYTGGQVKNPTYEQVSSGATGHAEAVEVVFDPAKTTYAQLLEVFWHNIDPMDASGQFCDHGSQYRSAIFYLDEAQKAAAEESRRKLEENPKFAGKIVTQIVPASVFFPAEEYHQDFAKKNAMQYGAYRMGCRRDARLTQIWGDAAGSHN